MVYVVQSYWACFGLYPSSCMWKTKNPTTFPRLDLSPSSGGWGRINLLSWARSKELVSITGPTISIVNLVPSRRPRIHASVSNSIVTLFLRFFETCAVGHAKKLYIFLFYLRACNCKHWNIKRQLDTEQLDTLIKHFGFSCSYFIVVNLLSVMKMGSPAWSTQFQIFTTLFGFLYCPWL
jgi:hypothetical protein